MWVQSLTHNSLPHCLLTGRTAIKFNQFTKHHIIQKCIYVIPDRGPVAVLLGLRKYHTSLVVRIVASAGWRPCDKITSMNALYNVRGIISLPTETLVWYARILRMSFSHVRIVSEWRTSWPNTNETHCLNIALATNTRKKPAGVFVLLFLDKFKYQESVYACLWALSRSIHGSICYYSKTTREIWVVEMFLYVCFA